MTDRVRTWAWPLWILGLLLAAPSAVVQASWAETTTARTALVVQSIGMAAVGLVGLLLTRRRPENTIGWLFLGVWVYNGLLAAVTAVAQWQVRNDASEVGRSLSTWFVNWGWVPLFGCVVLYPLLLFPTGHPVSPRWRPLVHVGVAVIVAWTASFALQPSQYADAFGHQLSEGNPYGVTVAEPVFDALPFALAMAFVVLVFAALWSLVLRFQGGDSVVRAQLKWFLLGGLCWLPVLLYPGDHGNGGLIDVFVGLALAAVPVAMGVAILRYRLYDIDRIISRTASYAIVTGLLLVVYAAAVTSVTRLLPDSSKLAVAAATLAAAALARPLLRRVQAVVDRRFNRARYHAEQTVDAFGARLRNEVDTDVVARDLTGVVATTLQPAGVSLWVRGDA